MRPPNFCSRIVPIGCFSGSTIAFLIVSPFSGTLGTARRSVLFGCVAACQRCGDSSVVVGGGGGIAGLKRGQCFCYGRLLCAHAFV